MHIHRFTFNPFQENTYLLSDETGACAIVDPGCHNASEQSALTDYIAENKLEPVLLLNTHCHIDHVMGNAFVARRFGLSPRIHPLESTILSSAVQVGLAFGITVEPSPDAVDILTPGSTISFGKTTLEILFAPGHSPGSVCFHHAASGQLVGGDVIFRHSIGRTDLPGGDYETLISSIRETLFKLPDTTVIHPGHGDSTTIGHEKKNNPFAGLNATHA
jgi:glyoxylase-like metal-dependent hydrolase (beta-lactamase superfamily II)